MVWSGLVRDRDDIVNYRERARRRHEGEGGLVDRQVG